MRSLPGVSAPCSHAHTSSGCFTYGLAPRLSALLRPGVRVARAPRCHFAHGTSSSTSGGARADGGATISAGWGSTRGGDPLIELLQQQSLQAPTIQVPRPAGSRPGSGGGGQHEQSSGAARAAAPPPPGPTLASILAADDAATAAGGRAAAAAGGRPPRPADMPFGEMYRRLTSFRARFGAAHVPRRCFDAPALGEWVRWLRRRRVEGRLTQWQVDRLDLLDFQWALPDAEAKWHHMFHTLRRYRAVHGDTLVSPRYGDRDEYDWVILGRWLQRQAKLFAKQRLPEARRRMLEAIGVTLRVPRRAVARCAALRGLNVHERRLQRRRWRDADRAAAAAAAGERAAARAAAADAAGAEAELWERRREVLRDATPSAARVARYAGGPAAQQARERREQQPQQGQERQQQEQQGQQQEQGQQQAVLHGSNRRLRGRRRHLSRQELWEQRRGG
ncbi:MAG: hypothetical protein J3K34DRAFT_527814 [Monoraphidium minutum]|nr:MAG: hypothetical protein J3K34DRAFT_527814 [Monoraphidium minutum]